MTEEEPKEEQPPNQPEETITSVEGVIVSDGMVEKTADLVNKLLVSGDPETTDEKNSGETNEKPNEENTVQENQENNKKEEINDNELSTFVTGTGNLPLINATEVTPDQQEDQSKRTGKTGRSTKSVRPIQLPPPSQEEINEAYNMLVKFKMPPNPNVKEAVIQKLNHDKLQALMNSDYKEAQKLDDAYLITNKDDMAYQAEQSEELRIQHLNERTKNMLDQIAQINEKYDNSIYAIKQNTNERYHDMTQKHHEELMQFRGKWQDPAFLKQFNRPSQRLLSMRHIEKKMALAKRYDDAKKTKRMADQLQIAEENQMQKLIEEQMRKEFIKMREIQQKAVNKMVFHEDAIIDEIEEARRKEIEPVETALKQMSIKKKATPNKKLATMPRQLLGGAQIIQPNAGPPSNPLSPRTASKMKKFRGEKKAELKIAPMDDEMFEKLTNSNSVVQKRRARTVQQFIHFPPI